MRGDGTRKPSFETEDLRRNLKQLLGKEFRGRKVGAWQWGIYAFYDYDGEPIYVGQTNERLSARVGRHLTNQRTDAVAMSVLDPFEVFEIELWPLPEFEGVTEKKAPEAFVEARRKLDALEFTIFQNAIAASKFKAILNEKDPPQSLRVEDLPPSLKGRVVSDDVSKIRAHPDFRIARRAQTLARLAQVISERLVQKGLRQTLLTQAKRLQWLAERRVNAGLPDDVEDDLDGET